MAFDLGWVSRFLGENPVVGFALGSVMLAVILRYLASFIKNDTRSDKIDRANDALLARFEKDVEKLGKRCDALEQERNTFFEKTVDLSADIKMLKDAVQRLENERRHLLDENIELRNENGRLRNEITTLKDKVAALERTVSPGPSTITPSAPAEVALAQTPNAALTGGLQP